MQWLIGACSSTCSISVLQSVVEMNCRSWTALYYKYWKSVQSWQVARTWSERKHTDCNVLVNLSTTYWVTDLCYRWWLWGLRRNHRLQNGREGCSCMEEVIPKMITHLVYFNTHTHTHTHTHTQSRHTYKWSHMYIIHIQTHLHWHMHTCICKGNILAPFPGSLLLECEYVGRVWYLFSCEHDVIGKSSERKPPCSFTVRLMLGM